MLTGRMPVINRARPYLCLIWFGDTGTAAPGGMGDTWSKRPAPVSGVGDAEAEVEFDLDPDSEGSDSDDEADNAAQPAGAFMGLGST